MDGSARSITVLLLLAAALIAAGMLFRFKGTNVLSIVAAYFFLISFGPVFNLLLGGQIYFGTRLDAVPRASLGFLLAIAGLFVADLVVPQRAMFSQSYLEADVLSRTYRRYRVALLGLSGFMALSLLAHVPLLLHGDKTAKAAGLPGHYVLLLVEATVLLLYFACLSGEDVRFAYRVNATVYLVYCVVSGERDFIFVLFVILVHRALLIGRVLSARGILFGVGAVLLAGALVSIRSHSSFDLTSILNQGSLLFVDSFVLTLVPTSMDFTGGGTYLDALHNVLPFGIGNNGQLPLDQWLVNNYVPGSNGGYGFSLTAEAYMNFGMVGIPVIFIALGVVQRFFVNAMDRSLASSYGSSLYLFALMYGLRGASSQLLKTLLYGVIVYVVLIMPVSYIRERRPLFYSKRING